MNELPDSAAWLAALVESSDDAIVSKTLDGIITSWNRAAQNMFGYSAAEAVGKNITLIIPLERRSEENYVLGQVRQGKGVEHFETVRVAKDGRSLHVSLTVSPIRNARGEIIGVSKIARDITERRRLEEAARVQREWFSTVLRSIGDAVIATDPRGVIRFINPVAESLTGWTDAEASGRPLREVFRLVEERTREPIESPAERVLRGGAVVGPPHRSLLIRRDGFGVSIEDSAAPIGGDGALIGVVLVFRDVSGRRNEETRRALLARASETLSSVLNYETTIASVARLAVPEIADWAAVDLLVDGRLQRLGVAHKDPEKVALVAEIERRYPTDPNAPRGTPNVLRTGVAELVPEISEEVIRAAARDAEHLALLEQLGLRSYVGVPLLVRGQVVGVFTFVMAESERRYGLDDLALAQALADRAAVAIENARLFRVAEEARAQAENASRAKDEFLAILSHELRTPLNAILGWSKILLLRALEDPETRRGLETIARNASAQAQLIEDLLDMSRIVSGKLRLDVLRVELASVVLAALDAVQPSADARSIEVRTAIDPRPDSVDGDPTRLQQVIWNLLSNAVKFTPRGGTIDVIVRRADALVEVVVRDSGAGISPEFLPHLFERFRQADSTTTRRYGGLGLGLSIVKQLVELHGGTVTAESEGSGKGSTFTVRLPLRESRDSGVARRERTPSASHPAIDPHEFSLQGLSVLVVDDEEDAREMISAVLTDASALVTTVSSVAEALTQMQSQRFDVIVSDIGMPGRDGYELLRDVRQLSPSAGGRTPAIALTAFARSEDRTRAMLAGYQVHVSKPIEPRELIATVKSLAGHGANREP